MAEPSLRERVRGCLLGGAIGDAVGLVTQWRALTLRRALPCPDLSAYTHVSCWWRPAGSVSDDTVLSMAVAESLAAAGAPDPSDAARRIVAAWPAVFGAGAATRRAVRSLSRGVPWEQAGVPSAGNGAAMRAAPIGLLLWGRLGEIPAAAAALSRITHTHPRALASATAIAAATALAAGEVADARGVLSTIAPLVAPDDPALAGWLLELPAWLGRPVAEVRRWLVRLDRPGFSLRGRSSRYTSWAVPTTLGALWAWLGARSFEDAIVRAVSLRIDDDTTGAIAGQLAGAASGFAAIRPGLVEGLAEHARWLAIADALADAAGGRRVTRAPPLGRG